MEDKFKEFKQAVFNRAYLGLKSQGFERSVEDSAPGVANFGCLYRSKVGACAIGYCIPDEKYGPEIEHRSAAAVLPLFDEALLKLLPNNFLADTEIDNATFDLGIWLENLQSCHDDSYEGPGRVERELIDFAHGHGLDIPED